MFHTRSHETVVNLSCFFSSSNRRCFMTSPTLAEFLKLSQNFLNLLKQESQNQMQFHSQTPKQGNNIFNSAVSNTWNSFFILKSLTHPTIHSAFCSSVGQVLTKRGSNSRFVVEANTKSLWLKSSRSQIVKINGSRLIYSTLSWISRRISSY